MGMDIHVVGVRDLDKTFKDMMAVKLACEKANVDYPNEVDDYFSEYGDVSDPEDSLRREMEHTKITTKKINETKKGRSTKSQSEQSLILSLIKRTSI